MPQIAYVIVVPKESVDIHTFFQGFSFSTLIAIRIGEHIARDLPATTEDIYAERDEIILARVIGIGSYLIQRGVSSGLPRLLSMVPGGTCTIIFYPIESASEVISMRKDMDILHVPYEITGTFPLFDVHFELTRDQVTTYVVRLALAQGFTGTPRARTVEILDHIERSHLTTRPNYAALRSVEYEFSSSETFISIDQDEYAKAICDSADALNAVRQKVAPGESPIILASPGLAWWFYKDANAIAYKFFPKDALARTVVRTIFKRKAYIQTADGELFLGEAAKAEDALMDAERFFETIKDSRAALPWLMRRLELLAFSSLVAIKAADSFSPVLRLPEMQAQLYGAVSSMGVVSGMLSGQGKPMNPARQRRKLSNCAVKISNIIRDNMPLRIYEKIVGGNGHICQVGDLPLELLEDGGIPIVMRRDISRIPPLPGDVFFTQSLRDTLIRVPFEPTSEILIVRALSPDDPLFPVMEKMLGYLDETQEELNVKFVDVATPTELFDAIANTTAKILIFDAHGEYDERTGAGGLRVRDEVVDFRGLSLPEKVPPIVLLSACNTHALSGSHLSAVNGFLELGSFTVLGATLPVNGERSARFFSALIGTLRNKTRSISYKPFIWSRFVGSVLRTFLILEMSEALMRAKWKLTEHAWESISLLAMEAMATGRDWFAVFVKAIAEEAHVDEAVIRTGIRSEAYFSHAASYVQFGLPDKILLFGDSSLIP